MKEAVGNGNVWRQLRAMERYTAGLDSADPHLVSLALDEAVNDKVLADLLACLDSLYQDQLGVRITEEERMCANEIILDGLVRADTA